MPKQKQWFKLDNAATVFPGQNTSRWSNIFRFSVMLTEKIDPDILEQALADVIPRFPCYDVRIRNGLFWHYFEKNPNGKEVASVQSLTERLPTPAASIWPMNSTTPWKSMGTGRIPRCAWRAKPHGA